MDYYHAPSLTLPSLAEGPTAEDIERAKGLLLRAR
jgi:hypothetical protein